MFDNPTLAYQIGDVSRQFTSWLCQLVDISGGLSNISIHNVVEDTFAELVTSAAYRTSADIPVADMDELGLNSFGYECPFELGQRRVCAALRAGTAVYQ